MLGSLKESYAWRILNEEFESHFQGLERKGVLGIWTSLLVVDSFESLVLRVTSGVSTCFLILSFNKHLLRVS